jgi:N-acetylmuramoyl-L-alanine amidase
MLRAPLRPGFVVCHSGALLSLLLAAGCAGRSAGGTAPVPSAAGAPSWPAIPQADGPLSLRVQYPSPNQLIAARDSTFLLGTVNHGGATLTINGAPIAVRPNGAFLAWVAMPPRSRAQFDLVATVAGAEPLRTTLPIRLPAERLPVDASRPPYFDTSSVLPRAAGLALRDDDPVRVSVRLAAGARADVLTPVCRRVRSGVAASSVCTVAVTRRR